MPSLFYTDTFVLPLPEGHRFPMAKYRLLRERIAAANWPDVSLEVPAAATDEQILRVHSPEYLERLIQGGLTRQEVLRTGFPWSPHLVERSRRSSGATIAACRAALRDGFSANLAGGTHHAFRDAGEGYCLFNDAVIAARDLQQTGEVRRVIVIDCDVHHGNGTAALCAGDESIFTYSIHGAKNFPSRKPPGDLDVPMPDGTDDAGYLEALESTLHIAFERAGADLAIYTAGADPYEHDRLGRMKLTRAGLAARDRLVYERCLAHGLPVAATMAGGYAADTEAIVAIHFETIRLGLEICARPVGREGPSDPQSDVSSASSS